MKLFVFATFILATFMVIAAQDVKHQTREGQFVTQEAIDAVQNQKISTLEVLTLATAQVVQDIRDKQNWILGGLAVISLLVGGIGLNVMQIRKGR